MIRHIVWWTLKETANGKTAAENATSIVEASPLLKGIPSVESVDVSAEILPTSTVPCQVILVSSHADAKALEEYKKDPVHVRFAQIVTAVSESRNCIDYTVEEF